MGRMKVASIHRVRVGRRKALPFAQSAIRAGFPSPAEDYADKPLDLTAHLVTNRASTFLFKVGGDSMEGCGIFDGDLLVVDRALSWSDGSIVVAVVDGGHTVKRIRQRGARVWLEAANKKYADITVASDDIVWGVVKHAIHTF